MLDTVDARQSRRPSKFSFRMVLSVAVSHELSSVGNYSILLLMTIIVEVGVCKKSVVKRRKMNLYTCCSEFSLASYLKLQLVAVEL